MPDHLSKTVLWYALLPFVTFFITHNFQHILWGICVISASLVAEGLKAATRATGIWPAAVWCRRPAGARDCDTWNRNGPQGGAPGFPSGHTATAAAFWMGAWLLTPATSSYRDLVSVVGYMAVVAMAWARLKKRCHTVLQTLGGGVLGAGITYGILQWIAAN